MKNMNVVKLMGTKETNLQFNLMFRVEYSLDYEVKIFIF